MVFGSENHRGSISVVHVSDNRCVIFFTMEQFMLYMYFCKINKVFQYIHGWVLFVQIVLVGWNRFHLCTLIVGVSGVGRGMLRVYIALFNLWTLVTIAPRVVLSPDHYKLVRRYDVICKLIQIVNTHTRGMTSNRVVYWPLTG